MAENRLARDVVTRTTSERPKQWQQPELLPEPDKQPGYAYRWIRVSTLGESDARNVSAKLREGWEAVRVEEQPQFKYFLDSNSRYKDCVEIGGLILCKAPADLMKQRDEYYQRQAQAQVEALDNSFLRQEDKRMPLFAERKSQVSFGKGK